jgi:hypothetical protein
MPAGECDICLNIRVAGDRPFVSWNIYHLACVSPNKKRVKFVEHLLKTLPEELTHELMAQTSKEAFNTIRHSYLPLISHHSAINLSP